MRFRRFPAVLARLLTVSLLTIFLALHGTPAEAAEITFGAPTSIPELLDSPEYLPEHAPVARLYQAFFSRTPDVAGLVYWINRYEDGVGMVELIANFEGSVEFQNTYSSSLDDRAFLTIVYRNVLERNYDQAGFDYWLGQMRNGLSRSETVFYVSQSDEFARNYPYAPTFPDVSSTFASGSAIPRDLHLVGSGRMSLTSSAYDNLPYCERLEHLHYNASFRTWESDPAFTTMGQQIYVYSTVEQAAAELYEQVEWLEHGCGNRTFRTGDGDLAAIDCLEPDPFYYEDAIANEAFMVACDLQFEGVYSHAELVVLYLRLGPIVTKTWELAPDYQRLGSMRSEVVTAAEATHQNLHDLFSN